MNWKVKQMIQDIYYMKNKNYSHYNLTEILARLAEKNSDVEYNKEKYDMFDSCRLEDLFRDDGDVNVIENAVKQVKANKPLYPFTTTTDISIFDKEENKRYWIRLRLKTAQTGRNRLRWKQIKETYLAKENLYWDDIVIPLYDDGNIDLKVVDLELYEMN